MYRLYYRLFLLYVSYSVRRIYIILLSIVPFWISYFKKKLTRFIVFTIQDIFDILRLASLPRCINVKHFIPRKKVSYIDTHTAVNGTSRFSRSPIEQTFLTRALRRISHWPRNDDNFESEFSYQVKAAAADVLVASGERDTVTKFDSKLESFRSRDREMRITKSLEIDFFKGTDLSLSNIYVSKYYLRDKYDVISEHA